MSDNENNNYDLKHRYWANAIGFIAFCTLLIFLMKGCDDVLIEREKTEQIKIQNGK